MTQHVTQAINDLEKKLALYKFVLEKAPDAKLHYTWFSFSAKSVNSNYTKYEIVKRHLSYHVVPYLELDFEYLGKIEKIRINSSPRSSRLVYINHDRNKGKRVIKFSRLAINLKNNNFKDDMLDSCRIAILDFIKTHPGFELDKKYLEPRLKKLLLFT